MEFMKCESKTALINSFTILIFLFYDEYSFVETFNFRNIFFTNTKAGKIYVVSDVGKHLRTIIEGSQRKPGSIAVNPLLG